MFEDPISYDVSASLKTSHFGKHVLLKLEDDVPDRN